MKNFNKVFPILNQYTYLNTAASGLLPLPVLEWRQEHDLDFFIGGSLLKAKQTDFLTSVREKAGALFHCAPERVALSPNFSYGFNTLLEGIDTTKKILLIEDDYPSVNWPFTSRDFNVSFVPMKAALEEAIASAFAKAQPDIFAFSLVQWITGLKIDQDFLTQLKQQYPETLFFADATQYLGTERFHFDDSALDVVGASCYKWMNAGYGNAVYFFKDRVADSITPKTTGFNSLQGKYKPQEGSFIGRFEPGHQDTLNYGSLGAAIDFINDVGLETIESRIQHLSTLAKEAFTERGLLDPELAKRKTYAPIFNIKGDQQRLDQLKAADVLCMMRGDGIRVAFHYFNTEADLERLLKHL